MRASERLSRRDRRRWRFAPVLALVLGAMVVVAAVLAYRIYWEPPIAPATRVTAVPTVADLRARCETLVREAYAAFGLSDTIAGGALEGERAGGGTHRAFKQGWPRELPLLAFAARLNALAAAESLGCDCLESPREGWLDCALVASGGVGARITLQANPETNFANREIALVFTNFNALTVEEIASLLKSGMQLSYIAGPDAAPTARVRELISKRGITAILRLPASEKGWRDIAAVAGLGRKDGRKPAAGRPDRALIDEALERHPAARMIFFDPAAGIDGELVEKIAQRAKAKKMALLIEPDQPAALVEAATRAGMTIYRARFDRILAGKPLPDMRNDLMRALVAGGPPKASLACPDAAGLTLENLWLFKTYFEKLGLRFRPLQKVVEPFEGPAPAGS